MLAGRQQEAQANRDWKMEAAREHQQNRRQRAAWRMKRITSGFVTADNSVRILLFASAPIFKWMVGKPHLSAQENLQTAKSRQHQSGS